MNKPQPVKQQQAPIVKQQPASPKSLVKDEPQAEVPMEKEEEKEIEIEEKIEPG